MCFVYCFSGVALQVGDGPRLQAYLAPSNTVEVWVDGSEWADATSINNAAVIRDGECIIKLYMIFSFNQ